MRLPPSRVRVATPADAAACRAIYAPYVTDTVITFETDVPTEEAMAARIAAANAGHAWLVLEHDGPEGARVVGYAYAHAFAERAAYAWSCESSIYLSPGLRRTGAGSALYGDLLPRLAGLGYRRVFAGVTLPNDASLGFHRAAGFEPVGTYRNVGWKNGSWLDVGWWQRDLGDGPPLDPPAGLPSGAPGTARH